MIYWPDSSGQIFHFLTLSYAALTRHGEGGGIRERLSPFNQPSGRNFSWLFRRPFHCLLATQDIRPSRILVFHVMRCYCVFLCIRRNEIFFERDEGGRRMSYRDPGLIGRPCRGRMSAVELYPSSSRICIIITSLLRKYAVCVCGGARKIRTKGQGYYGVCAVLMLRII